MKLIVLSCLLISAIIAITNYYKQPELVLVKSKIKGGKNKK